MEGNQTQDTKSELEEVNCKNCERRYVLQNGQDVDGTLNLCPNCRYQHNLRYKRAMRVPKRK